LKEKKNMIRSLQKAGAAAALTFVLTLGASRAPAILIDIAGGSSAQIGGWQIAPGTGINLTGISFDGTTISVENNAATFSSGTPLDIAFTQIADNAAPNIDFLGATILNSTGSNWTGFEFSLSGAAVFDGVGDIFVPPLSSGVNYSTALLNIDHNLLDYSGSQANGSTSTWGSSNPGDDLLIDTPAVPEDTYPSFSLSESPLGVSGGQTIPTPSAAWLSLAGLLTLAILPLARKRARVW
jgi:hypothetical protein